MQKVRFLITIVIFIFAQSIIAQTEECDQTSIQLIIDSGDWAEDITWSIY